jgi:hypothetical protein
MAEEAQAMPAAAAAEHPGPKTSSLAAAVHAKPFVPGGYTAALAHKQGVADASSEPSSPLIKGGSPGHVRES